MADLAYIKLPDEEVAERLKEINGWEITKGQLSKKFSFKTYADGIVFASAVGFLADALNHHPDIEIGYATVSIAVSTHDVGGLSPYDFELAKRIERLRA